MKAKFIAMYEAQSVTTGNWIKGTLEWDGLAMFIVEDHGFGKTKIQCIPGTERELNEDESGKIERKNHISRSRK